MRVSMYFSFINIVSLAAAAPALVAAAGTATAGTAAGAPAAAAAAKDKAVDAKEKERPAEKQPLGAALEKLFLELVLHVSIQTTTTRVEMAALEPAFMLGLRSNIPHIRQMFFAVFHKSIERGLPARLQYLLGSQSWESLSGTFWYVLTRGKGWLT